MARPKGTIIPFERLEFDSWDILNTALSYQATMAECASLLEVSEHTLIARIREKFDVTFLQYRDRFVNKNKVKFRQELFKMAISGKSPAVSIFYAKNVLGMSDKVEVQTTDINLTLEEYLKKVPSE